MGRKFYYISFLIFAYGIILFLAITDTKPHNPLEAYLLYFVFFSLIILRFIKEKYKNIVHAVFLLIFIGLILILRNNR